MALGIAPVLAQAPHGNPLSAGVAVDIPDIEVFLVPTIPNANNWEAYTTAFGDGTLALATNTRADGDLAGVTERGVVAFFNTNNSVDEVAGFLSDAGAPWVDNNDSARVDGNPPRIGADKRPGQTKYVFGNESTPWARPDLFPSFDADNTFVYSAQMAACQLLNKTAGGPVKIGNVIDPVIQFLPNALVDTRAQTSQLRYGGEIRGLSNGDFATIIDNRDHSFAFHLNGTTGFNTVPVSIIDQNTGLVSIGPFNPNPNDPTATLGNSGTWSNMAAFNGGFAVRIENPSGGGGGNIQFFNNAGVFQGTWDRTPIRTVLTDPLAPANGAATSITSNGGGGSRIDSHINSNFVYIAGAGVANEGAAEGVYLTKVNATTRLTVGEVWVSDNFIANPDRVNVCVDSDDTVFVCWSDTQNTGKRQIVGRAYDSNLVPLTDAFLCFSNSDLDGTDPDGFAIKHPSCSISNKRILVTGRVDNDTGGVPNLGLLSNAHLATVIRLVELPTLDVKNWNINQ
ncbi:MAG: hypothetical protein HUU16_19380 [Candidatus Omnitrophica bacterium]|nr:hypothetical protein [Candidatus Omnitrophota bacterium]